MRIAARLDCRCTHASIEFCQRRFPSGLGSFDMLEDNLANGLLRLILYKKKMTDDVLTRKPRNPVLIRVATIGIKTPLSFLAFKLAIYASASIRNSKTTSLLEEFRELLHGLSSSIFIVFIISKNFSNIRINLIVSYSNMKVKDESHLAKSKKSEKEIKEQVLAHELSIRASSYKIISYTVPSYGN